MDGVKEVRAALMNLINSISFGPALVTAAPVLALAYPVLHCIAAIRYIGFVSVLAALMYGPYLVGLILCFAKGIDRAPGAAFCIQALQVLIGFLCSPSVQEFLYLILYIALAAAAFQPFVSGSKRPGYSGAYSGGGRGAYGGNGQGSCAGRGGAQSGPVYCPNCGNLLRPGMKFCGNCGSPTPAQIVNAAPQNTPQGADSRNPQNTAQSGDSRSPQNTPQGADSRNPQNTPQCADSRSPQNTPQGADSRSPQNTPQGADSRSPRYGETLSLSRAGQEIVSLVTGPMMLIFAVLATLSCVMQPALNFGVLTVLISTPLIVILIGIWMSFVMLRSNPQEVSGITLIRGGLIAQFVICIIAFGIMLIAGVFILVMSADSSLRYYGGSGYAAAAGIAVIIVSAVLLILCIFCYKALLKMTKGIRDVLLGRACSFPSGILPAVLIVIAIIGNVIRLVVSMFIAGNMNSIISGIAGAFGMNAYLLLQIFSRYPNTGNVVLTVTGTLIAAAANVMGLLVYLKAKSISGMSGG